MDPNFLYNFLREQPLWLLHIMSFFSLFFIDVFYVFWILKIGERKKYIAGIHSVLLFYCNVVAFTSILEVYNILMHSGALGVYCGTISGVALDNWLSKRKASKNV
jgi:hypothetical protein